ncbi:riboflavin synthase subunit alpha [Gloeomargarita lithophora Alchichica-D10]|uniref:Riboflavin synthase n=1 Tax=Gloeomargarita lithophora Alchichica-D10 TaxID=1188229 RepID=A0A1J0AG58_9CYAN|nr:riboflavin synthase [Gloeomargarita lithophora]APB34930.1 riboflavin synthase subunit alpha [Gloeomargarita lithophora Alchichica-D10]
MFTGLIHTLGQVVTQTQNRLTIAAPMSYFPDVAVGDSIAVDGVCLTVTAYDSQGFTAATSPETRQRSTLGQRLWVNLEPALRVGQKLGGHFVSGHVDGVGSLTRSERVGGDFWELDFSAPPAVGRYLIPKGSIAVNGVSLTIAQVLGNGLQAAVIPLTYEATNLHHLRPGDPVNLEADVLGKYVEKFLQPGATNPALSENFLTQHGFMGSGSNLVQ